MEVALVILETSLKMQRFFLDASVMCFTSSTDLVSSIESPRWSAEFTGELDGNVTLRSSLTNCVSCEWVLEQKKI